MTEREIFTAALHKEKIAERAAYLDEACAGDAALRQRVESLLAEHQQLGSFMEVPVSEATIDQPPMERIGTMIGPYKLLQQIGEGGFGVVFMAEQLDPVRRKVALKVIKPGMDTRQVIARFEAERQALAVMDHVNIARVLDAGATEAGRLYFVMELVHGVPITKYCDDNRLTPRQRLELFVPVCQAIQHAHQKGIIHRDIKPTNVMITLYDGKPVPKVIDFGVAKATEQKLTERTLFTQYGTMVGTPEYMSPEQAEMSALGADTRSDIFSLGVLLYELLTGSTPLSHKRIKEAAYGEVLRMIREEEAPKPSTRLSDSGEALASISAQRHMEPAKLAKLVRGELDWIVMKTLEKDRNRRYETASGFAADVQRYLNDEAVHACPPSAGYRFRKFAWRNRVAMMTTGLVALALVAGMVVSAWQAIRATRARQDAEVARTDADQRRIEADEQRQQAEDSRKEALANLQKAREAGEEFFTRVSENRLLEEPGLQPLRKELLEAGVAYYEGLAAGKSEDPQSQADLIVSRLRLVQIYFQTLSRDQHILALEKGIEVVEEFLRAHPDATSEHLKLAGFFHGGRGVGGDRDQPLTDRDRALRVYEQATALWEKLVKRYPTATGFQSDLSKFYDLQGNVQLQVGRREEALRTRQKVCEIRELIVRANPGVYEHVAELGYAYQALAVLLEVSDPEAAEVLYRQSLSIQKDAPDIVTYQNFLATHRAIFGRFLGKRKRPEEAIQLLQQSLGILEKLAGDFPYESTFLTRAERLREEIRTLSQNTSGTGQVQRADENQPQQQQALALLRGLNRDGDAYRAASEPQKSEHSYRMAITRFKALPPELSTVSGCRESLMQAYVRLGDLLSANEPPEGAEQAYREALEVAQKLVSDFPGVPDYRTRLANLHRALAQLYSRVGRAQEAEQAYRQAIDLLAALTAEVPQVETHWYNLGLDQAQLGQWDQAVAGYTKAIELNPDFRDAWRERGWAHGNLGQWAKAVADHTKAIELKPDVAGAWHGRGWAHANLRQWDKAVADYTKAIELKPDLGHAWRGRGFAHAQLGQWDEAVTDQTKALELMPKNWHSWWRRAQAYSALEQWDAAIADYAKAIELGATDADVWLSKAAAHASLEQWEQALADYAKAIELNAGHLPGAVERFKAAGRSQEAEQLVRQAAVDAKKLTAEFPQAQTHWYRLGLVHAQLAQWDQAVAGYTKAIELKPDYWEAWQHRGWAHFNLGQWAKAVADHTKAIELKPSFGDAWHMRGWAHAQLGQWDKVVADHTKAIELKPDSGDVWHYRGFAHANLGQWDKAVADQTKALELMPRHWWTWWRRGQAYRALEQWDKAAADLAKAAELAPKQAEPWYELGLVQSMLGQTDQSVASQTKAIELNDSPDAWHNRGFQYANLGQWDKAIADQTKAAQLSPTDWRIWWRRGQAYTALKQWEKAILDYAKAIELGATDADVWLSRGAAHTSLEQWDQARADYAKAIELNAVHLPGAVERFKAAGRSQEAEQLVREVVADAERLTAEFPLAETHWHHLGFVHAHLGQWDQAIAGYSKAIELKPDYWEAWTHRGHAHVNLGQWNQAVADNTKAIELKSDSWYGWHGRGWAHANLAQWDKAVADQTKALELMPKHWWTWYRRGQGYSALAQWDQAIPDYAQAIELGATDADVWLSKAAAHARLDQPDQAIAELKQAIAKGFRDATHLKNHDDLAGLREREDFKQLVADLEANSK